MANHYLNTDQKSNDLMNFRCAKAVIDVGTTGTLASSDIVYTGVRIPDGSVITRCWYFVNTTLTGGGTDAATPKLGLVSDDDEFVAAIAISDASNVWDAGSHGTLVGFGGVESGDNAETAIENAASGSATFVHCTTDDEIIFTKGTNTITAGKLTVFVEYYASGDLS